MQARLIEGGRGWRWLAEGWRLFRASPGMWLALVFVYYMLMMVVSLLPVVGVVAAMVLVPGLSVGFMAASADADRGRELSVSSLFSALRSGPASQLTLGGVYFASIVLMLLSTALADEGALARWFLTGQRPAIEVLQSEGFLVALGLASLLYLPVMMLFWFAPVLAAWHAMPVGKALFYSFFACLMNWRAFMSFGLASAVVLFVVPFTALLVMMLASGGALRPAVLSFMFPFLLAMMPTLYASFYASYREIFAEVEPESAPAAEPADPADPGAPD